MKVFVDNAIINLLSHSPHEIIKYPLLSDPHNHLGLGWASLLEYLGLDAIFKALPGFDHTQPIFKAYLATLSVHQEDETLFYLYDTLFVECLTQIKALPQMYVDFFLEAIKTKRQQASFLTIEKLFSPDLTAYENAFKEKPSETMHHLILYLAWDRMCVYIGRIFDQPSMDANFIKNLEVLKNCLIESYQHIMQDSRAFPSFYRLAEALFFFYMREEHLQKHKDAEWLTLSQSFSVFKASDELADFLYIDHAVVPEGSKVPEKTECFATFNSADNVNMRIAFANLIMDKLKSEVIQWGYALQKKEIACFDPNK